MQLKVKKKLFLKPNDPCGLLYLKHIHSIHLSPSLIPACYVSRPERFHVNNENLTDVSYRTKDNDNIKNMGRNYMLIHLLVVC